MFRAVEQSDELLALILADRPDGPVVIGANQGFCRMSGFAQATLDGMGLTDLLAPEADDAAPLRAILANGASGRVRLLCRGAKGPAFAFEAEAIGAGQPGTLVLLGRDGTAELRAGEQQRSVQALLATVFLSVPMPVAVIGVDGRFQMTNPALDRLAGYGPGEMIGLPSLDFVAPSSRDAARAARERQIADGSDYMIVLDTLRRDGTSFGAEISSVLVRGAGPQRLRIMTVRPTGTGDAPPRMQVAGRVKLVGLETVKTELGDRWPALAERALATAEHVIRKRIAPADTFARTEDDGFLLCFAAASEEEASFRAFVIGREIRQRLIGEGEKPTVAHVTAMVDRVAVKSEQERPLAALETHLTARLDERMAAVQAEARLVLADAIGGATCAAEAVYGRTGRKPVAGLVRLAAPIGVRLQAAAAALPAEEVMELDLDAFLLRLADGHARTEALRGIKTPMLVSVSFDPFLSRIRTERYLAACRTLDTGVQQRLVLLLSHLPAGLARARVEDSVQRLKPFCRAVGFEIGDLDMPLTEPTGSSGTIVAVSADASPALSAGRSTQLSGFLAGLHARPCKLLVRSVRDWAEAERLRALGVDLVSLAADEARADP